ncbi:MAG: hypothetical protein U1F68_11955 [Gammaproteobacteria bacterium]
MDTALGCELWQRRRPVREYAGSHLPQGTVEQLLVSRANATILAITAERLWISVDGGEHWQACRWRSCASTPWRSIGLARAAVGGSGGATWVGEDRGGHWQTLGQPLPKADTVVRGLAISADGAAIVLNTHRGLAQRRPRAELGTGRE